MQFAVSWRIPKVHPQSQAATSATLAAPPAPHPAQSDFVNESNPQQSSQPSKRAPLLVPSYEFPAPQTWLVRRTERYGVGDNQDWVFELWDESPAILREAPAFRSHETSAPIAGKYFHAAPACRLPPVRYAERFPSNNRRNKSSLLSCSTQIIGDA